MFNKTTRVNTLSEVAEEYMRTPQIAIGKEIDMHGFFVKGYQRNGGKRQDAVHRSTRYKEINAVFGSL